MGIGKILILSIRKKVYLYTDHQALEPLIERNRCNKQYSARLTRWLDRLTHFDISIQDIAGNNLKCTDYLSKNPVGGATPEEKYVDEYVITILFEHAKLDSKHGTLFADQSKQSKSETEIRGNATEAKDERNENQSQINRTFENKNSVNKIELSKPTTSGQSDISTSKSSHISLEQNSNKKMDQKNFYHWGATH